MTDVLERFEEKLGESGEALEHQRQCYLDLRFLLDHLPEWRQKYPNRWVAVYRQRLVAVEETPEQLLRVIREHDIPVAEAILDFLTEEKVAYVLKLD